MVATLNEYRRRGLAAAVIRTALTDLKASSVRTVTLRAEPYAANLYRRLGFVEYCPRVVAGYGAWAVGENAVHKLE